MTNLNLELIEKVRNGAIIEHKSMKELATQLNEVIFAVTGLSKNLYGDCNYYGLDDKGNVLTTDIAFQGAEIIPLSAFFTNELLKEDLNLIAQIDARLKHYNLIQPIDTTEGEQEQGKEWKFGEWAWNSYTKNFLGIITRLDLSDIAEVTLDNQNGESKIFATSTMLLKPTTEEIQAHLVEIAQKKYPVGAKIKNNGHDESTKGCGVLSNIRDYSLEDLGLWAEATDGYCVLLWSPTKGWAELAPIETEQRYEVVTALMPSCDDDYMIVVSSSISTKLQKLKAEELAEAIKQYLSTNKF